MSYQHGPDSDRPNLLLADDDVTLSSVLARALEARGFEVRVANDGQTALRLAEEMTPEYAVLDLQLPDTTGLKLIQKLKQIDDNTNIVLLTGYGSIATAIEAVKLGATYYLTKPTDVDQIVAAFERKQANPDVMVTAKPLSVDRVEWEHIQRVLADNQNNISATARALNMHRRTLQRKLSKRPPRS
ncbi:response regulator consisting of a CheY-like receiver domain and a Fis-type HTH domain [Burkholderiales bacterium JOSHI_001]|nr:response regulator consisting of a CheY-like receiver domain and a Fis-type HTH domain [Burkholderiales bacterium JOSHI_001]